MFRLHLTAILALVLVVGVVITHNVPYRHRHVPSRSHGGSYGHRPSYVGHSLASLIGTPAKVVQVTVPSHSHGHPYRGQAHGVSAHPQHTFGTNRVPASSFNAPGNIQGSTSGISGSPSNTVGVGTGNVPAISGPGPQFSSSEVTGGSIIDSVNIRPNIEVTAEESGGSLGGSCPPVRASCTTFRTTPPSCTTDDTCFQGHKCCFDTCVQRNICKSVI